MTNRMFRALILMFVVLGTSAAADAATVTLQWDRNSEPTVTGYLVSYGTQSGNYATTINVGNQTSWTGALNPVVTSTYYFAVRAYTATATSAYSGEVSTTIVPSQPQLTIDAPGSGTLQGSDLLLAGWAVDKASTTGTGIDAIHVYAYPNPGSGIAPVFLGLAAYGGSRPDVAAVLGASRYTNSGYTLPIVGLPVGVWQLSVYAHSTISGDFAIVKSTRITVYGAANAPAPKGEMAAIGVPVMSSTATSWVSVGGWALDMRSAGGPGVDVVQVWAYPNPGSGTAPLFLGNAPYGRARADVAALFGSKFLNSGFHLDVMGMAEGLYDIVVLPKSTVSNAYEVARVSRVMVKPSVMMTIDTPTAGLTVGTTFTVSGWSFDRRATGNAGIDVLHVWAYPAGVNTTPLFVGVATTGMSRPDVASAFGSQYSHAGFSVVGHLSPGAYDMVIFAHSTISNNFENARVVRVNVQ